MTGRKAPRILALETATSRASVALLEGEALRAERRSEPGESAGATLLRLIDAVLAEAGIALDAVSAFAVSIGPGSFTGLRVGVATAKGLAFGGERPLLPVPTLAALAALAPPGPGPAVALLDARRGEVYAAGYSEPDTARADVLPEGVYGAAELAAALPRRCRLVGEGLEVCGAALRAALGPGPTFTPPPRGEPRAASVGRLAALSLARGEGVAAAALVPRYVRRAEAEVKRTGERFEGSDDAAGGADPGGASL